jgi:L-2-hydroxycarboxylate dehydrogenase (NAD+)
MAEIRALLQLNKELPLNKAIDNNGMPTTDPQQALDGCVLPFDDYKGYALALAIEIIAGPLINAKAGKSVKGNRGFFIMAIKFQSDEFKMKFQKNVMTLFDEIENSKKMKSIDKIRIPGMQSLKNFKSAQNYGIEVDERIYNYLHKMVKS